MTKFLPDPKPVKRKLTKKTFDRSRIKLRKLGKGNANVIKWDHLFFIDWWNEKPNICFECGEIIHGNYDPQKIHHLIHQGDFKKYSIDIVHDKDNLVKLHWHCHSQAHWNIDKTPKIKEATIKIKEDYLKYRI